MKAILCAIVLMASFSIASAELGQANVCDSGNLAKKNTKMAGARCCKANKCKMLKGCPINLPAGKAQKKCNKKGWHLCTQKELGNCCGGNDKCDKNPVWVVKNTDPNVILPPPCPGKPPVQNCDSAFSNGKFSSLAANNLGGKGPNKGQTKAIIYSNYVQQGEQNVNLVVKALSDYNMPVSPKKNGIMSNKEFGLIQVGGGTSTDVEFSFVDAKSGEPVEVLDIFFTFYDLDQAKGKKDSAREQIAICGADTIKLTPTTKIQTLKERKNGCPVFSSTGKGANVPNPKSAAGLTNAQRDVSVSAKFTSVSKIKVNLALTGAGKGSRNIMFSSVGVLCNEPSPKNPCLNQNGGCDLEHATCSVDGKNESVCKCVAPYTGDGIECSAPNPCAKNNGGCHKQATCTNNSGEASCECKNGFEGNGKQCQKIDPCKDNGPCSADAVCKVFEDAATCQCKEGFHGNGIECTDNPCMGAGNGGCDDNATCENKGGRPWCRCKGGFRGDGKTCTHGGCIVITYESGLESSHASRNQQAQLGQTYRVSQFGGRSFGVSAARVRGCTVQFKDNGGGTRCTLGSGDHQDAYDSRGFPVMCNNDQVTQYTIISMDGGAEGHSIDGGSWGDEGSNTGGLELRGKIPYYLGKPICGHHFWDNDVTATKFCKMMGRGEGKVVQETRGKFTYGVESIFLGVCDAEGDFPDKCRGRGDKQAQCTGSDKVGVEMTCTGKSGPPDSGSGNEGGITPENCKWVKTNINAPGETRIEGILKDRAACIRKVMKDFPQHKVANGVERDGGFACWAQKTNNMQEQPNNTYFTCDLETIGKSPSTPKPPPSNDHIITIGNSHSREKHVHVGFPVSCPGSVDKNNWATPANCADRFSIHVNGNSVMARREDSHQGWGMNLQIKCQKLNTVSVALAVEDDEEIGHYVYEDLEDDLARRPGQPKSGFHRGDDEEIGHYVYQDLEDDLAKRPGQPKSGFHRGDDEEIGHYVYEELENGLPACPNGRTTENCLCNGLTTCDPSTINKYCWQSGACAGRAEDCPVKDGSAAAPFFCRCGGFKNCRQGQFCSYTPGQGRPKCRKRRSRAEEEVGRESESGFDFNNFVLMAFICSIFFGIGYYTSTYKRKSSTLIADYQTMEMIETN